MMGVRFVRLVFRGGRNLLRVVWRIGGNTPALGAWHAFNAWETARGAWRDTQFYADRTALLQFTRHLLDHCARNDVNAGRGPGCAAHLLLRIGESAGDGQQ